VAAKLNLKLYHSNTSLFPKIAIVERVIRSLKKIYFRFLLRLKTNDIAKLVSLSTSVYNNRKHTSLKSGDTIFTPIEAHFSSHAASLINRQNIQDEGRKQIVYASIFKNISKQNRLVEGDEVFLRKKKSVIRKESAVFNPNLDTTTIYKVTKVDRTKFPHVFSLSGKLKNRKFYFFELQKIDQFYHDNKQRDEIKVLDIVKSYDIGEGTLRSGRKLEKDQTVEYLIRRSGKNSDEIISRIELSLYKKLFGKSSLQYSEKFENVELEKYIV